MQTTQILLKTLLLFMVISLSDGRFFCYRRLKKRNKCGGYLRNEGYSNVNECCVNKGQGYADKKMKIGRNRFRCTPCPGVEPKSSGKKVRDPVIPINRKLSSKQREETTIAPSTTTEFYWPTPARRKYMVDPDYPPLRDDDGQIITWESWSPCSVSCGAGWRSRAKVCDNCDRNDYENVKTEPCMINFYCPVDGNWGPWFPWESCSTTCGGGTRTRHRKCNYPPPAYGGADCEEDAVAVNECNSKSCPIDGQWSEWSALTPCSTSCGPGFAKRSRRCDLPVPENGGKDCLGPDSFRQKCEVVKCPVDGRWSLWSTWSRCSATCGRGLKERTRTCDSPKPQHGGKECDGPALQQEACHGGRACPVDGGWSDWTDYGNCRAARCSRGSQIRSRSCTNPAPKYGGRNCEGQQYERVICFNDHDCPRNGSWCQWSEWNACSSSCGEETSIRGRQRMCACPSALNGGLECAGPSFQVKECKDIPPCGLRTVSSDASENGSTDEQETGSDSRSSTTHKSPTMTLSEKRNQQTSA